MNEHKILLISKNQQVNAYLQRNLQEIDHIYYKFIISSDDMVELHQLLSNEKFSYAILFCDSDEEYYLHHKIVSHDQPACQILMVCSQEDAFFRRQIQECYFAIRISCLELDVDILKKRLCFQQQKDLVYNFHQLNNQRSLHVQHIYYIESMKNYILVHKEKEAIKDRFTMKSICKDAALQNFILISRGILINPMHIEKYEHRMVQLQNGVVLYISKSLYSSVISTLEELERSK